MSCNLLLIMRSTYLGLIFVSAALAIGGCTLLNAEPFTNQVNPPVNPIDARAIALQPAPAAQAQTKPAVSQTTVTRYKIDDQCQALQPTDLTVPAATSLDSTIQTIVGDRSNGNFRISGYRINRDAATKTATLDLRLPPDSARSIYSLSHCEQFALLGELRQTLIANSAWQITTVNFQVQGENIEY